MNLIQNRCGLGDYLTICYFLLDSNGKIRILGSLGSKKSHSKVLAKIGLSKVPIFPSVFGDLHEHLF